MTTEARKKIQRTAQAAFADEKSAQAALREIHAIVEDDGEWMEDGDDDDDDDDEPQESLLDVAMDMLGVSDDSDEDEEE